MGGLCRRWWWLKRRLPGGRDGVVVAAVWCVAVEQWSGGGCCLVLAVEQWSGGGCNNGRSGLCLGCWQSWVVEEKGSEKPVLMVAVDDSVHSYYALEWTLDHFFAAYGPDHPFKLKLVHARPTPFPSSDSPDPVSVDPYQVIVLIC
ncbi:hypothetical protein LWI29_033925 [Acer saccharum]|uniref:Uncharacterized protein n=1 Tax=Acer saccharum TaxID=4024 RepID=A0AA39SZW7_ACESA|nr:hypothetical protein LWI29_033925 [Acer saccharum]